jgi:hypothetical protein
MIRVELRVEKIRNTIIAIDRWNDADHTDDGSSQNDGIEHDRCRFRGVSKR